MEFLKNNKRFKFKIGGKDIWGLPFLTEERTDGDRLITEYLFDCGIKVTNIARKYEDFGAYEWVSFFENTAPQPSEIITELWDCDCTLPIEAEEDRKWQAYFPNRETATKIYAPTGSDWSAEEFFCDADELRDNSYINHIYPGDTKAYSASNGRASEKRAPFFNIHKNGTGYIFAIGWSGQWNAEISRSRDTITLKSKIEDTAFRLMPGEKFRTSSAVIMPYTGDVIHSHNKWRKLVREHFSQIGTDRRDTHGPLCAGVWGGMTTDSVLERIDYIKKNRLPFEYIWMDAGWYGIDTEATPDEFEGDWWSHTGDWRVSPKIHPDELRDVSKAVHDAGMKFLLWFEPERVVRHVPAPLEHPEYFLSSDRAEDTNRMLNLGNPDAWEYCFNTLSGMISELNIDCLRIDFNFSPLIFWRRKDAPDRIGICEIKYINGLYRLWDALSERFPNMLIDNCASGGRRIDIETLRRSIPLWRSDYQCPANYDPEGSQCHNLCFNLWMPYSGTGSGRLYEEYRVRSSYAAALTVNWLFSEKDKNFLLPENIAFIKKYTEEYLRVRPYFSEDFYPLTEISSNLDVWCGMQFDRPSEGDGIVEIFRRDRSPYETASFALGGISRGKEYIFTDADGGEFRVSGAELSEKGFTVAVPEKRKAKIYFYKSV